MRQGNGTDLLGMNDPRSATIGVIYVSPVDDRKSVLAAILTQENLNRQHIVVVLPNPNNAFQRQQDFDDLKSVQRKRKLQGEIIFIAPDGPGPAEFARQRRFPVYASPEEYTQALRDGEDEEFAEPEPEQAQEKRSRFFGGRAKTAGAAAAGAIAGAAAARQEPEGAPDEPQSTMIFPGYKGPNQQSNRTIRQAPAAQSRVPNTPNRSTLDDDDDLGDEPIAPPVRNSNIAGAAALGAGAGLAAESFRRTPSVVPSGNLDDDEDDEIENQPTRGQGENASRSPRNSNPLAGNPDAAPGSGAPGGPGIIDLQPVTPKAGGRNPVGPAKPSEPPISTPVPEDLDAEENFAPPPPTHGARRRRTGSMATGAAGAAGAGAFAAMGAGASNTGPHAISSGPGNTMVGPMTPIQYPPSRNTPPQRPDRTGRRSRGRGILIALILIVLMFLLGGCIFASVSPTLFQSYIGHPISNIIPAGSNAASPVTVTITPKSQVVNGMYVIQAVTANPKPDSLQVSLRNLTATPPSQSKTVTGTGHTQTDPVAATGTLKFTNGLSTSQTLSVNQVISGPNGITYTPNKQVTIPPINVAAGTIGSITVTAHANTAGTAGNMSAGTISEKTCCVGGGTITVTSGAFTGGQNSQNYTFVQQSDVQAVVNPLVNTLAQQAKDQFNQQLTANEALAENPSCPAPTVTDDPGAIGDKGHSIPSLAVTVSATCTGIAYDKTGAQKVAQQGLQKNANTNPGPGYVQSGPISTKIVKVTPQSQDAVSLQVQAQGTWDYQITDAQKTALAKQLAGKKVAAAQAILNAQPGFKTATIKSSAGDNATLPTDPTQIKIDVQAVSGSSNGTPTPGSSNPTPSNPAATPTSTVGRGMLPAATLKG